MIFDSAGEFNFGVRGYLTYKRTWPERVMGCTDGSLMILNTRGVGVSQVGGRFLVGDIPLYAKIVPPDRERLILIRYVKKHQMVGGGVHGLVTDDPEHLQPGTCRMGYRGISPIINAGTGEPRP